MRRFQSFSIMDWAAVGLVASAVSVAAQSQSGVTIRLATQDLPPYQMIVFDEDSNTPELHGLAVDLSLIHISEPTRPY